jgi:hypothetical protein
MESHCSYARKTTAWPRLRADGESSGMRSPLPQRNSVAVRFYSRESILVLTHSSLAASAVAEINGALAQFVDARGPHPHLSRGMGITLSEVTRFALPCLICFPWINIVVELRKHAQDAFRYDAKRASLDILAVDAKFHVVLYPH